MNFETEYKLEYNCLSKEETKPKGFITNYKNNYNSTSIPEDFLSPEEYYEIYGRIKYK